MRECELREIQCIVCSTLHQMFISDPKLAKLVHFQVHGICQNIAHFPTTLSTCILSDILQGYDPQLLPVTVSGIPSIHICLNFIAELLNQPEMQKQVSIMPRRLVSITAF